MRWEDERYVRFYTRDLPEWLALSWRARGLFGLLLRAADRAGILKVGKLGLKGAATAVAAPWVEIEGPLKELLDDGCIVSRGPVLVIPNYIAAQEAVASGKLRTEAWRERRAALSDAMASDEALPLTVTNRTLDVDDTSQNVTFGDAERRGVTLVTPSHAVPSRTVPNQETTLSAKPTDADRVFAEWCSVMGKRGALFKGKRKSNVLARLKDGYSVERLCAAVRGCALDPWSMGQNERGKPFNDLELICRSSTKVEEFEAMVASQPASRNGDGGLAAAKARAAATDALVAQYQPEVKRA